MRVFIDTNILISTIINSNSTPAKAFFKALAFPHQGLISTEVIRELNDVFNRKFPDKVVLLKPFITLAAYNLIIIQTQKEVIPEENLIRDEKDKPILRAAIQGKADILLTGDKDFLESGITHPMIMTAAQFLLQENLLSAAVDSIYH